MGRNKIRLVVYGTGRVFASIAGVFHAGAGRAMNRGLAKYHANTSTLAKENAETRANHADTHMQARITRATMNQQRQSKEHEGAQIAGTVKKHGHETRQTTTTLETEKRKRLGVEGSETRQTLQRESTHKQRETQLAGRLDRSNLDKKHQDEKKIIKSEKRNKALDDQLAALETQEQQLKQKQEVQGKVKEKQKTVAAEQTKAYKNDIEIEKSALESVKKYREAEREILAVEEGITQEHAGITLDQARHQLALDVIQHQLEMDVEHAQHSAAETKNSAKHRTKQQNKAVTGEHKQQRRSETAKANQRKYLAKVTANLDIKELKQLRGVINEQLSAKHFERVQEQRAAMGQNTLAAVAQGTHYGREANATDMAIAGQIKGYNADVQASQRQIGQLLGQGANLREVLTDMDEIIDQEIKFRVHENVDVQPEQKVEIVLDVDERIEDVRAKHGDGVAREFELARDSMSSPAAGVTNQGTVTKGTEMARVASGGANRDKNKESVHAEDNSNKSNPPTLG